MRRRAFTTRRRAFLLNATVGVLAAPGAALAQTKAKRRLAIVHPVRTREEAGADGVRFYGDLFAELRRLGYAEDTNLVVESWSAKGETARYEALVREVLATKPDAVLVFLSRLAVHFRKAGSEVPVVFAGGSAIAFGVVDSLARPGGNLTGLSFEDDSMLGAKAVELVHEFVPTARTVALLVHRNLWDTNDGPGFRAAAHSRGLTPIGMLLNDPMGPAEYRRVFSEVGIRGVDMLLVSGMAEITIYRPLIVELASQYELPAFYTSFDVRGHHGELATYGSDLAELPRVLANYVARVLNGEKPAEMPVRVLDKYKLVINLKAAKALGLTIPPAILARADEVIE